MVKSFPLDSFLSSHAFGFMLLLSRVGAIMMLFPGIGDRYVPSRMRLSFALLLCALLLEPMLPRLPPLPTAPAETARLMVYEMVVGLFFGTLVRLIVSTLEATGSIIGMEAGLSNATMMNPALAIQSPLPSAFLGVAGVALVFISGLDHFLLRSIVGLYDIFPVGGAFMPGDMAQTVMNVANHSFVLGIEFAAPFFIMGILLYTSFGIMQRLMPQVQIFMLLMPLQIWGGLIMFSLTIASILGLWLKFFDQSVGSFFQK